MKSQLTMYGTLVIFILATGMFSTPTIAAVNHTEANGVVQIETDQIKINVTGNSNVPVYFFQNVNSSARDRHRIQFSQLFEFEDTNNNGKYDNEDTKIETSLVALASLNVELGTISTETGVSFNMSLTAQSIVSLQFKKITFRNHVSSDNTSKLKFDVIIDNYNFISSDNKLALAFQVSSSVSNTTTNTASSEMTTLNFGENAYFQSNNTAKVGNTDVDVGMSVNETNSGATMAYITYDSFSGQLVHDPEMGITSSSNSDSVDDNNDPENNSVPLPIIGLISLTILPIAKIAKRKYIERN